jgi:hypothetical protein
VDGTGGYCLRSPGDVTRSSYYPTVTTCNPTGVVATDLQWTVRGDTGNSTTMYRIESTYQAPAGSAHCLSVSDPEASSPDLWNDSGFNLNVSKLILQSCSNSELQKWNAFTLTTKGSLNDLTEP